MAKLFPFRPAETPEVESEPRLVGIDDEAADEVFAALSSETARDILSTLYEDPATASDVADEADTSLQNARYHLDKLQAAGLVQEVDTWYSSRGTEMTVYGPTSEPLVVAAGEEESRSVLRSALKRVVGAVGVLGIASLAVDRLVRRSGPAYLGAGGAGAPRSSGPTDEIAMYDGTPTETEAGTPEPATAGMDATHAATNTPMGTPTGTPARTPAPEATGTPRATATAGNLRETTPTPDEVTVQAATRTPSSPPERAEATRQAAERAVRTVAEGPGGFDPASVSPGLLFFAGGLLAVTLAIGWWYWSRYRPLYRG